MRFRTETLRGFTFLLREIGSVDLEHRDVAVSRSRGIEHVRVLSGNPNRIRGNASFQKLEYSSPRVAPGYKIEKLVEENGTNPEGYKRRSVAES